VSGVERDPIAPVVGLGRLVGSREQSICEFTEYLIMVRAQEAPAGGFSHGDLCPSADYWSARVARWITWRDSGPRQFKLSQGARAVLLEYANEAAGRGSGPRWLRKGLLTAIQVGLNLHVWIPDAGEQITENTIISAVELTRWFANETTATAGACVVTAQDRKLREAAAIMLQKLRRFSGPVRPRELYKRYNDERVSLHRPVLEYLLRSGQARMLKDRRVEPGLKGRS